jgi:hypothetical protein
MTDRIETRPFNSITKGRSFEMDRVEEAMEALMQAMMMLPGWPELGNHGPIPDYASEITLIVETTGGPWDHGRQRHPGTEMVFRWWPDGFVPPESQVAVPYDER